MVLDQEEKYQLCKKMADENTHLQNDKNMLKGCAVGGGAGFLLGGTFVGGFGDVS